MNSKLLSICIPTYNRAEVLDDTLKSLFSNSEFDESKIEVIVSDNCSTDSTKEIVEKYPLVKYYRNSENVRDLNFSIALSYAIGSYIRLFNDTLSFKKGTLKLMLDRIEKHLDDNCNLFFYGNMFLNSDCTKVINGKDNFINTVSYYSTWIANFGCWRKDFKKISNKDRYVKLQFVQVDWSYRIIENNRKTIIYFEDLFDIAVLNKKGGYNVFDTFVNKYSYIIKQENLSLLKYEKEKYRLCRYFILPWLKSLFINDKSKYSFETNNVYRILLKKYWYEPYFYVFFFVFLFKKVKR